MNKRHIIIGFDSDTKLSGIVIYDNTAKCFLYNLDIDFINLTVKFMPKIYKQFQGCFVDVLIEMPTQKTSFQVSCQGTKYECHNNGFSSGRCAEIANQFEDCCVKFGFVTTRINSEKRVRLDLAKNKLMTKQEIITSSKALKKQGRYYSKATQKQRKELFDIDLTGSEQCDAALLILPYLYS